jgi:putative aldouronate transport system permease protein
MYGAIIAFKDFSPSKGILGSPWVGFKHFINFFEGHYFRRLVMNTLMINVYDLIFGFPAPIILALLINEVKSKFYKRTVQTISYLPHFISLVVICGIIVDFTAKDGIISQLISIFGGEKRNLLLQPQLFKTIYVSTNIWQSMGWSSIIYLAALSGIDPHLYEAATTDGANRWRQTISITIPGILPTVFTLLVLRIGQMMNVGFEKIFLLYNPVTYETADVISTFVYRVGLLDANFSYSAAVGLFNSVINFALVIIANNLSRRFNEASLW